MKRRSIVAIAATAARGVVAGAEGFDTIGDDQTAGDSMFIAVHPWMQGKISVR